jgi:TetR/AcrR family tetracycline transcriptional repressor
MPLQKEQIVEEGLKLLAREGLEGVTLRKLATRLRVKAPSLYWHFKSKEKLLVDMAETLLTAEFLELVPHSGKLPWQVWFIEIMVRLRQVMLSHKDGARIIADAHASPMMARLTEVCLQSINGAGVPLSQARLIVMSVLHYVAGHATAEQNAPSPQLQRSFDAPRFVRTYPTFSKAVSEYYGAGKTADDNFEDGLMSILGYNSKS